MNKTEVMITGSWEWQKVMQKAVGWLCGVCGEVMKSLVCRGCVNPVTGTESTSVDIGVNANLELVDKFCYLGDMLSVDGDADAAVETRIRTGWNKFRQLVSLLTNRDIWLIVRGRSYSSCVRSSMLHGSKTWPIKRKMRWYFNGQRLRHKIEFQVMG